MTITHWRDICDGQHCGADPGAYSHDRKSEKFQMQIQCRRRDMCNRNWIYALPLTILFALHATTSHAQEVIGKASSVVPQATGSHAGPLSGGSNVYSKETIRTGQ